MEKKSLSKIGGDVLVFLEKKGLIEESSIRPGPELSKFMGGDRKGQLP
jgi:hypothetical protein